MKKKNIILLTILLLFTNCGYKIINKSDTNYHITNIELKGDKKINFKIRNELLFDSNEKSQNKIILKINTNKFKNIKETNIKNEITKYEIIINTKVEANLIGNKNIYKFEIIELGDYTISSSRINSLNSEKKLINNLSETITDQIRKNIILKMYDF